MDGSWWFTILSPVWDWDLLLRSPKMSEVSIHQGKCAHLNRPLQPVSPWVPQVAPSLQSVFPPRTHSWDVGLEAMPGSSTWICSMFNPGNSHSNSHSNYLLHLVTVVQSNHQFQAGETSRDLCLQSCTIVSTTPLDLSGKHAPNSSKSHSLN